MKQSQKVDPKGHEVQNEDIIIDMPATNTGVIPDKNILPTVFAGHSDPIHQFIEWPIIRPDGALQPIQYRASGHLQSIGITPENIQAANLISMCMLSARLGHPISAMLEPDNAQEAVQLLDQCLRIVPKDAVIEFPEFKQEHLYIDHGRLLDGKCILSPTVNGFSKVSRDLELILTRGYSVQQEVTKGKYKVDLSEHRSEMRVSVLGITGGTPGKELSLPSVLKIPVVGNQGTISQSMPDLYERYGLIHSPLFKFRKSFQRLKPQPVVIPYEQQLETAFIESGCDHAVEKLTILKHLISICAIIGNPPTVEMAELGALMFGTDEDEVRYWLINAGIAKGTEPVSNGPLVATKVEYHISRLLLDGMLLVGSTRFTDRQKMIFDTVKTLNMAKLSTALLSKGDDVEKLSTIAQGSGYWATREKIFEKIGRSDAQFSLSSMSNDLMVLVTMGVLERAKPPKSRYYGYYITTPTLENAIGLPAPETIQDPIYEGKEVLVVNPLSGQVEKI